MSDLTRAEVEQIKAMLPTLLHPAVSLSTAAKFEALCNSWLTLDARVRKVEEAGKAFIKRYDELMPYVVNDRHISLIHGVPWNHGNWQQEIDRLRELCQQKEGEQE